MATFRPYYSGYNEPDSSTYFASERKSGPKEESGTSSGVKMVFMRGSFERKTSLGKPKAQHVGFKLLRVGYAPQPIRDEGIVGVEVEGMREVIQLITNRPEERSPFQAKKTAAKAVVRLTSVVDELVKLRVEELLGDVSFFKAPVEEASSPAPTHTPGYEAAVASGAEFRTRIFKSSEMMSSDALARSLGVSRETVNSRRNEGSLLGLTNGTRVVRYPAWQLEGQVLPVMPELLRILNNFDAWAVYLFITQESPLLDGRSPLEALRAGDRDRVLDAAKSYADAMA